METPLPNFYFMGVQFIHLLALSIWVGGIVIIRLTLAPTLLQFVSSRQMADRLLSEVFRKFNKTTLFCAVALIITGVIKFLSWENLTPWNTIRYFSIALMSLISLYVSLKGSAQGIPSLTDTSKNGPKLIASKLNRYRSVSERLTIISLICGVTALLMA